MADSKYITVNKVVQNKDSSKCIEQETILISDIKSFRTWHKDESDEQYIEGEMTQVSLFSVTGKDGFYTIRINESSKQFAERLGPNIVINLNA